jgi:hypothetical protein
MAYEEANLKHPTCVTIVTVHEETRFTPQHW